MIKVTIFDAVTKAGTPYNIPFYFGCGKYLDRFEYFVAHIMGEYYQIAEYPDVVHMADLPKDALELKEEILRRFHTWSMQ